MKTSCGETSEVLAASLHGVVAIIYLVMLAWHGVSVIKHWQRQGAVIPQTPGLPPFFGAFDKDE